MPTRQSAPGSRHRRDNGPLTFDVQPAAPPDLNQIGQTTRWTTDIIQGGPRATIAAHRKAEELARQFGTDFESRWCLTTPWLQTSRPRGSAPSANPGRRPHYLNRPGLQDNGECAQRAYMRATLAWRCRFLACLALTHSTIIASRAATVSPNTVYNHRKADPDFEMQCAEAEEHAIQLLKDVVFRRALEGDLEPIFWQGITVGHVRKFDGRLQIEMLRALDSKRFKTPGAKDQPTGSVNIEQALIVTPEVLAMIQSARQTNQIALRDAHDITPPPSS